MPDGDGTPAYTSTFITTIDHGPPLTAVGRLVRDRNERIAAAHGERRGPGSSQPLDLDQTNTQNLTSLKGRIDASKYFAASSDIVAFMTLEHQLGAVNRINVLDNHYHLRQGRRDEG